MLLMPKIKFLVEHRQVDIAAGISVRVAAQAQGINLDREFFRGLNCRGHGLCGMCSVWVRETEPGAASRVNLRERFHGMGDGRRLACQARVQGEVEVTSMPGGDDRIMPERAIDSVPDPVPA